jgi:hypothetical protein
MTQIKRIEVRILTGDRTNAGTDGEVYLGICGREFHIDSSEEDFDRGFDKTYVLGEALVGDTVVIDKEHNDPRADNPLDSADLDKFPAYIRFDQSGDSSAWNLEFVEARVKSGVGAPNLARYTALPSREKNLWLGKNFGSFCYLLKD